MHEIANHEAITYALLWIVGALASLARSLNDPNYRASWRVLGAVGCGGFLGTAAVGILSASDTSGSFTGGYSIGIASLAGLLGKDSDQWLRWLTSKVSAGKIQLPPGDKPDP